MKTQTRKITTNSESEINSLLEIGQFIRNGNGSLFQITALNDTKIQLTTMNESKTKRSIMDRSIFVKLYYRKNYDQVLNPDKFLIDLTESMKTGATRFMIK